MYTETCHQTCTRSTFNTIAVHRTSVTSSCLADTVNEPNSLKTFHKTHHANDSDVINVGELTINGV